MTVPANHQRTGLSRAVLVVAALLGAGALAAGCGGGPAARSVVSLGKTTTATGPAGATTGGTSSPTDDILAFVNCMRTHGVPNMPDPSASKGSGGHVSVQIVVGAGVDPSSPQFAAASRACNHLLPNRGVPSAPRTITPADQADYLKGAACMRSHGFPAFPDPTFRNGNVTFSTQAPIDSSSTRYKRALATCQKLIPPGLPYSSSGAP